MVIILYGCVVMEYYTKKELGKKMEKNLQFHSTIVKPTLTTDAEKYFYMFCNKRH